MVFREVYQDLMNKELRLSQNFEKLRVVRSETAMLRTPFLTDLEGILMGHQALRKHPGKGRGAAAAGRRRTLQAGASMRLLVSVLVWTVASLTNAVGQGKGPSISAENSSRDLGQVTQGEAAAGQVFAFSNRGAGTLEILAAEHPWGCEAALRSAKKKAAGKSGQGKHGRA